MAFKIKNRKVVGTIDIEPTWENLCNMVQSGHLEGKFLQPACKIADRIRQAQKQGKKSITFKFKDKQSKAIVVTDK